MSLDSTVLMGGEIDGTCGDRRAPELLNELKAICFVRDRASFHALRGDFVGRVASKFHATEKFLQTILGPELYAWAANSGDEISYPIDPC